VDGFHPLDHHPAREGSQERWFPVRAHRPSHQPPLRHCLHGHRSLQRLRQEARPARLRDHSLSVLGYLVGFPFIKNNKSNPTTTIKAI